MASSLPSSQPSDLVARLAAVQGLTDLQRELLHRWGEFLNLAWSVADHAHLDAAHRYILVFRGLPVENLAEWSRQHAAVAAYATTHQQDILVNNSPGSLPRATRDMSFENVGVEVSFNVASVLFACEGHEYAGQLWNALRTVAFVAAGTGDAVAPAPLPVALGTSAQAQTPPIGNFLATLIQTMTSIAETDIRSDPIPEGAAVDPGRIATTVMRCLSDPRMTTMIGQVMQHAAAGQLGNPETITPERVVQDLFHMSR